jgi:NAD(P)H-dependent FMN reductase
MPNLLIVLASTRPGRIGLPVSTWFRARAVDDGRFDVSLVDLAELALPFLDEPDPPVMRRYVRSHTLAWSNIVESADAIVVVTPEYNYGYPAALKNALDYLNHEWRHKPIGFVSYGGVSAGTRAVQQLLQVVTALRLVPASTAVHIPFVFAMLDHQTQLTANEVMEDAASTMLTELLEMTGALMPLRRRLALASAHPDTEPMDD